MKCFSPPCFTTSHFSTSINTIIYTHHSIEDFWSVDLAGSGKKQAGYSPQPPLFGSPFGPPLGTPFGSHFGTLLWPIFEPSPHFCTSSPLPSFWPLFPTQPYTIFARPCSPKTNHWARRRCCLAPLGQEGAQWKVLDLIVFGEQGLPRFACHKDGLTGVGGRPAMMSPMDVNKC